MDSETSWLVKGLGCSNNYERICLFRVGTNGVPIIGTTTNLKVSSKKKKLT
jgi:hypothetical protein